jgi:hypothetical protein
VAQCHGADTGLTAQYRTLAGMASPGGLAEQHRDMIPRRGVDSSLTRALAGVRTLNALVGGAGAGAAGPREPRARRSLTRGGDQPLSEAKFHPRGRPALERGGTSLEGATGPRTRRNLTQGGDQPSSEAKFRAVPPPSNEAEFRPRGAGADRSGGPLGPSGPWAPATGV